MKEPQVQKYNCLEALSCELHSAIVSLLIVASLFWAHTAPESALRMWIFFLILLCAKELDMDLSEIVEDILNMHDNTKVGICYFPVISINSIIIFNLCT